MCADVMSRRTAVKMLAAVPALGLAQAPGRPGQRPAPPVPNAVGPDRLPSALRRNISTLFPPTALVATNTAPALPSSQALLASDGESGQLHPGGPGRQLRHRDTGR